MAYSQIISYISHKEELLKETRKELKSLTFFLDFNKKMKQTVGKNPMNGPNPPPLPEIIDRL